MSADTPNAWGRQAPWLAEESKYHHVLDDVIQDTTPILEEIIEEALFEYLGDAIQQSIVHCSKTEQEQDDLMDQRDDLRLEAFLKLLKKITIDYEQN